jgi:hypothetical protein
MRSAPDKPVEWEYGYFLRHWGPGKGGSYPLGDGKTEYHARVFYWSDNQSWILPELQKYMDEGWQPLTEVGPNAYAFRRHGGSPDWLEVKEFRVKLRRPKTLPTPEHVARLLGRWQRTEITGKGLKGGLLAGVGKAVGVLSTDFVLEFLPDGIVRSGKVGRDPTGQGVYSFLDRDSFIYVLDGAAVEPLVAKMQGDELFVEEAYGQQRFHRMR